MAAVRSDMAIETKFPWLVAAGFPFASPQVPEASDDDSLCTRPSAENAFVVDDFFAPKLRKLMSLPFDRRIECLSRRFLGLPYADDPLGEGRRGDFDRDPMFRFDRLDCMTYVEEAMALSMSLSFDGFLKRLTEIRYRDEGPGRGGPKEYVDRLHFVEADWIKENSARGYIEEITEMIGGKNVGKIEIKVDRATWIRAKFAAIEKEIREKMHFEGSPNHKLAIKLKEMRQQRRDMMDDLKRIGLYEPHLTSMNYVPIAALLGSGGTAMIEKLPDVSIMLMIRNQEMAEKIGVIVAHMAFLIVPRNADGTRGAPIIRHASSKAGKFLDEPFLDYIRAEQKTRAGVAILKMKEKK